MVINSTLELIRSAITGGIAVFSVDNLKAKNYSVPVVSLNSFSVVGNLLNLNVSIFVSHKNNLDLHNLIEIILNSANGVTVGNQRLSINSGEIFRDTDLFTCVLSGVIQVPNIPDSILIESILGAGSHTFNENCEV